MIVTDDAELAARAKHLTTQAKTSARGYVHDDGGLQLPPDQRGRGRSGSPSSSG